MLFESTTAPGPLARLSLLARHPRAVLVADRAGTRVATASGVTAVAGDPLDALRALLREVPPGAWPDEGGIAGVLAYDYARPRPPRGPDAAAVRARGRPLPGGRRDARGRRRRAAAARPRVRRRALDAAAPPACRARARPASRRGRACRARTTARSVLRVKEHMAAGDIYQANLSQRFQLPFAAGGLDLYRQLRALRPRRSRATSARAGFEIASASPERLLRGPRRTASTRPIAGTRPRAADPAADRALAAELMLSEKERAEHLMLVDLARNDLGRVAAMGSVSVDELMAVEDYAQVRHIVSNVRGAPGGRARRARRAAARSSPAAPSPACPRSAACAILDALEPVPRGFYTGALFYLTTSGRLDANILIRSAVVAGRRGHLPRGRRHRGRLRSRPRVRGDAAQGGGHAAGAPGRPERRQSARDTFAAMLLPATFIALIAVAPAAPKPSPSPSPAAVAADPSEGAQGAQHRPRGHGRPRLGHRPRPAGPVHVLRRPGHRRPHEDRQRRRHVRRGLREGGASRRSGPWRWRRRIRRSSGSAPARPTTATARAGATASTARPTAAAPGRTSGLARQPHHRAHRRPPDAIPDTAWVAAMGDLWDAGGERGLYKTTDGGQDVEGACSPAPAPLRRTASAAATWRSTPRTRTRSTPRSTRAGARRGRSRAGPTPPTARTWAASSRARTAAPPGRSSTSGLPGAHRPHRPRRLRARTRGSSTRSCRATRAARSGIDEVRSQGGRRVPLGRRRRDAGRARARSTRGRSTSARSAWTPRTTSASTCSASRCTSRKTAGERSARTASRRCTPTCHALAIDPRNPKRLLLGTDGGVYQSYDGGETWEHLNRMAAGEFYRINVDDSTPYRICGGLQDNLNWVGPSRTRTQGRHPERRLDQHRRRRRLLLRVRPRRTRTSSTPSRRRATSTASTCGAAQVKDAAARARRRAGRLPLPLELAAHRQPRTRRARCTSAATACSS